MEDISTLEARIGLLRRQEIPIPDEEIREVEAELAASRRLLQRHGISEKIQKLQADVHQQEVFYFLLIAFCGNILILFWYFLELFWYCCVLYGTVGSVLGSILAQSMKLLVLFLSFGTLKTFFWNCFGTF